MNKMLEYVLNILYAITDVCLFFNLHLKTGFYYKHKLS